MYLKQKRKNQNKLEKMKDDYNKLSRMNQRVLTTNCLKIIFILQYLVLWQKKYMRQKIKRKTMS